MSPLSILRTPPPDVAVEITARHVAAVVLAGGASGQARVAAHAVEPLPPGAVTPALNGVNLARPGDVVQALTRAWSALGRRPKRVALAVPDGMAKV